MSHCFRTLDFRCHTDFLEPSACLCSSVVLYAATQLTLLRPHFFSLAFANLNPSQGLLHTLVRERQSVVDPCSRVLLLPLIRVFGPSGTGLVGAIRVRCSPPFSSSFSFSSLGSSQTDLGSGRLSPVYHLLAKPCSFPGFRWRLGLCLD